MIASGKTSYQPATIRRITEEIRDSSANYISILRENDFEAQFHPRILEWLCHHGTLTVEACPSLVQIVLTSYLSWICILEVSKYQHGHLVIEALVKVREASGGDESGVGMVLISAVYHTMKACVSVPFQEAARAPGAWEPSIDVFGLLMTMLRVVGGGQQREIVLDYVGRLCTEMGATFAPDVSESIISTLLPDISEWDRPSRTLFSVLAPRLPEEALGRAVYLLVSAIGRVMRDSKHFIFEEFVGELPPELPPLTASHVMLHFWDKEVFVNGIDLELNVAFPAKEDFKSFLPDSVREMLVTVVKAVKNKPDMTDFLRDSMALLVTQVPSGDMYLAFLFVCFKLRRRNFNAKLVDVLLSYPFFDPRATVFDQGTNYKKIDVLRCGAIDVILTGCIQFVDLVLLKWVQYPYLFAEMVHRIIRSQVIKATDKQSMKGFVKGLMAAAMYYQRLHYSTSDQEPIEVARNAIFMLISKVFLIPGAPFLLFGNQLFASFFMSFVFEVPLRSYVLSQVLAFLSKQQSEIPHELVDGIVQTLEICAPMMLEEKSVVLAHDIVYTLNDGLIHQRSVANCLEVVAAPLCSSLMDLRPSDLGTRYLMQCVQYFALTSLTHSVTFSQLAALEKAILTVFEDEVPAKLKNKLIQMMAGEWLSSFNPAFLIRQPKVLQLFLKVFSRNEGFIEAVRYVSQLCQFSAANCQACHTCGFDIFLLGMIKEMMNEDVQVTSELLILFQHVTSVISSGVVVQKFVSLLAPSDGCVLPPRLNKYLMTLIKIVADSALLPLTSVPLTKSGTIVDIQCITGVDLVEGLTFVFWIYLDSNEVGYKPSVMSIGDKYGNGLDLFFSSQRQLFCRQRSGKYMSDGRIDNPLPEKRWSCVTVTYQMRPAEGVATVVAYYDGVPQKPLEYVPMTFRGPVCAKIGGVMADSTSPDELVSRVASFGVFPLLSTENMTSFLHLGARVGGDMPVRPYFFYTVEEDDGKVALRLKGSMGNVEMKMSSPAIQRHSTFADVLVRFCKAEILLPLFAGLDMKMKDGTTCPNHVMLIMELLKTTVSISIQAQESFARASGFAIVSHLLQTVSEEHINYALYLQFFDMAQCISSENLVRLLLRNILFNVDIWIRCDSDNHMRIVRHWGRLLIPSTKVFVADVAPFQYVLFVMQMYYWYEVSPEEICFQKDSLRARGGDLNIVECRQLLSSIAITSAAACFDENDYLCIASYCLTSTELFQKIDLLKIMYALCQTSPCPLVGLGVDFMSFAYELMTDSEQLVIMTVMELVVMFRRADVISSDVLADSFVRMQGKFGAAMESKSLFTSMTSLLLQSYYEVFPIFCSAAMSCQEKDIVDMLDQLTPDKSYAWHESWCLYAVVLCYHHGSPRLQRHVLAFLVGCSVSEWQRIYATVYNTGFVLDRHDRRDVQSLLLMEMARFEHHTPSSVTIFFDMCKNEILSQPKMDYTALQIHHRQSPFAWVLPGPARSPSVVSVKQHVLVDTGSTSSYMARHKSMDQEAVRSLTAPVSIATMFMSYKPVATSYCMGLRWDEYGEWTDRNVALEVIRLFMEFHHDQDILQRFVSLDLILCSFLVRTCRSEIVHHMANLELAKEILEAHLPLIHLLNHHATADGSEPILFSSSRQAMEEGSYAAMRRVSVMGDSELFIRKNMELLREFLGGTTRKSIFKRLAASAPDMAVIAADRINGEIEKRKKTMVKNRRHWVKLWQCLATDRAPWSGGYVGEVPFKRDKTYCTFFCPFKVKRGVTATAQLYDSAEADSPSGSAQKLIADDFVDRLRRYNKGEAAMPLYDVGDVNDQRDDRADAAVKEYRSDIQNVILSVPCEYITVTSTSKNEREAKFILSRKFITIKELTKGHKGDKIIKLNEVAYMFFRRSYHRPNSIEIFTTMGKSYYIHFNKHNSLTILRKIASLPLPNIKMMQTTGFFSFFQKHKLTGLWEQNKVSNFEYLMHLNMMSGRSYNDTSQYPFFPWIFCDYKSQLDMESKASFRDLRKPIGALNTERLSLLQQKYQDMVNRGEEPFLYDKGSVCVLSACVYLVRLEPFAAHHARLGLSEVFESVDDTFDLVSGTSNDFRELIPEFYFMPEFLCDQNRYDQPSSESRRVSPVKLPDWAKTPDEFVYIQRKGMESDFVSETICHWIDLTWGINQARLSDNVFRPEMYESAWSTESISGEQRAKLENVLLHHGQVPPQLFRTPHPSRKKNRFTKRLMEMLIVPAKHVTDVAICHIDCNQDNAFCITIISAKGKAAVHHTNYGRDPLSRTVSCSEIQQAAAGGSVRPSQLKMTFNVKDIPKFEGEWVGDINRATGSVKMPDGRFAMVSGTTSKVVLVDAGNKSIEAAPPHVSDAICLASSGRFLAVASSDAVLYIYKYENGVLSLVVAMPSYRDAISCAAVSASFLVAVTGTKDGSLIVNSLNRGAIVRTLDLKGGRARMVTITNAWGFIVAYVTKLVNGKQSHFIYVFNVNGVRLRKTKIGFAVTTWITWASAKGFDYMLISDANGKLFSFEVFYCVIQESFFRCHSPISTLSYVKDISCAVAVTQDARIILIPHSISE